jgi:hypothetical protein
MVREIIKTLSFLFRALDSTKIEAVRSHFHLRGGLGCAPCKAWNPQINKVSPYQSQRGAIGKEI